MSEGRSDYVGYAAAWAAHADRYATDYRHGLDGDALQYTVADVAGLRDQAERMALMWARIAELHPVEQLEVVPADEINKGSITLKCGNCGVACDPVDHACGRECTGGCTATFTITAASVRVGAGTTHSCALTAGHYTGNWDDPDGVHRNLAEVSSTEVSMSWSDEADGAVPHGGIRGEPGSTMPS